MHTCPIGCMCTFLLRANVNQWRNKIERKEWLCVVLCPASFFRTPEKSLESGVTSIEFDSSTCDMW